MNIFYVYVYLDPRKPGKYKYGSYEFEYEPFYVGKGSGLRYIDNRRSGYFKNKINKIKESELKPIIIKVKDLLFEQEAFCLEIELIKLIGRINMNNGPLINFTDGGEGVSGCVYTEERKRKLSKRMSGKNNHMFGVHLCGKKNPRFGKHWSEKWKHEQSDRKIGSWLGAKNPKIKLNEEKVRIIREILKSVIIKRLKITMNEIGEVFGVSKSTIIDIKYKRSWSHI